MNSIADKLRHITNLLGSGDKYRRLLLLLFKKKHMIESFWVAIKKERESQKRQ